MNCAHCGEPITQRYAGTFWKAPDPMPMVWVHTATDDNACGYATPLTGQSLTRTQVDRG